MTRTQESESIPAAVALAARFAADADRSGEFPAGALERFGELGVFRLRLGAYAELLAAVASECLSSAFSLWAHRMVLEYLRASGGFGELIADLESGRRAGSIAMASAMQELAGVGAVPTRAVPEGDGYRVHGRIAWASNVAPGSVIVFPARVADTPEPAADEDDAGERAILTAIAGSDGLTSREVQDLLALGATRSAMLTFEGMRVERSGVVAASLAACAARRSTHLLLQSAFCLGLAERCLREGGAQFGGPGAVLGGAHAKLAAQLERLQPQLAAYVAAQDGAPGPGGTPGPGGAPTPQDVTLLRYEAARLALAAARLESTLVGGRGYVTTSGTNRRLREASFLPVQSPSEVQLLQELRGYGLHIAADSEFSGCVEDPAASPASEAATRATAGPIGTP